MAEEGITVESGPDAGNAADEQNNPITVEGSEAADSGNWNEMLPEEYRESSWATKYSSAEELWKGVDNMASLVGKKAEGITLPGEDATDEDWSNFYEGIGRPEDPNGYKLNISADNGQYLQEGDTDAIVNMLHKAGLNNKQAQDVLDGYFEWSNGKIGATIESMTEMRAASEKALQGEWGADYEKNVETARRGAAAAGVLDALDEAGLGNNPAVIKLAELAGRNVSEDSLKGGDSFSTSISKQQAEIELNKITSDPRFRQDPAKNQRASELMDIIGGGSQNANGGFSATVRF